MNGNGIVFENSSVNISNRKTVCISGVKEVLLFDDETINLDSILGKISIKGENLRVTDFNEEIGELKANGTIHGVIYLSDSGEKCGFFSRVFK